MRALGAPTCPSEEGSMKFDYFLGFLFFPRYTCSPTDAAFGDISWAVLCKGHHNI